MSNPPPSVALRGGKPKKEQKICWRKIFGRVNATGSFRVAAGLKREGWSRVVAGDGELAYRALIVVRCVCRSLVKLCGSAIANTRAIVAVFLFPPTHPVVGYIVFG